GIAGIGLVLWHTGLAGLGRFLGRLGRVRLPTGWWLFLILGVPALFYAGAALSGTIGDPFPFTSWTAAAGALAVTLVIGPIEEFGWRGLMLPLLQRRFMPFWAGIIVGVVWGLWHVPAFLLSGTPHSAWSFGPFFLGAV